MVQKLESKQAEAHALVDQLDLAQLSTVVDLLRMLVDAEDETLSEEEEEMIRRSREYFRENPDGGIPFEQVVEELGFTMEQIRKGSREG